ncbi:MAG: cobalamin B12-binding domain-containing protein, partial [Actinomycetales bacterium]|nr:cobalamin B12-binding domain-containing protein [Actinomycetales bacterium]
MGRLRAPRLLLVALYHPEIFPLPRFPLGISDLARAARASLHGQVRLLDMQLGVDLEGILDEVEQWRPDIIGISATFGQHDVMAELLDHLTTLESVPLLIAGGSLVARNQELLERSFPDLLVCRGAGEE